MAQDEPNLVTLFENLNPTFWKKGRLQTFEHWPFSSSKHNCNPENMATAGFFAIGGKDEPDLVECFMCNKQLDGWEPHDDPWEEHKKHQPNCSFIKLDKRDEGSLTVKDLFSLLQNYYKYKRNLDFEKTLDITKKKWQQVESTIPDVCNAIKKSQKNTD